MGVNSANKGYIGINAQPAFGSYNGIENTRTEYINVPPTKITPYTRPTEWITIPSITQGQQIFIGTFAVYNNDSNFVAFTVAGNYNVNWGDGTTGAFSSGVQANKRYDTTTYSGLTSAVFRGYKTLNITITPQSGANITSINLANKHNQSTLSDYTNQWLDIKFSAPNLTASSSSYFMYSETIPMGMLEQFEWVNTNTTYNQVNYDNLFRNCYSLQNIISIPKSTTTLNRQMFQNCYMLQQIPWFDTNSTTTMLSMFTNCTSLKTIPLLDTSNVTDFSSMFNGCVSLEYIPTINTSKGTVFTSMFASCFSLAEIPLLNMSNGTSINSVFFACYSLKTIPLLNTSKATNLSGLVRFCRSLEVMPLIDTSSATTLNSMFDNCLSLRTVPTFNTQNVTDFAAMFYDCGSLEEIPPINTSKGTNFTSFCSYSPNISKIPNLDLSSGITFTEMFRLCRNIKYFPDFNISKGLLFNGMFQQCATLLSAPNLTLGTAGITFATNAFDNMFSSNTRMTEVPAYDLRGVSFGSGYASVYSNMLVGCPSLSKVGITGFNHNISISAAKLGATALNELYTSLAVVGASGSATKTITVSNNWGAATDDPSIAIAKGWQVTG